MKKLTWIFLFLCFSTTVIGQGWTSSNSAFNERWYTYWALGAANLEYADDNRQNMYEAFEKVADNRLTINLDLLGIYIPITTNTIAGVIINATGDRFNINDEWVQENYYTWSVSGIHYLSTFGKGLFVRLDGGFASYNYQDSDGKNETAEETGYGVLVGGGYSFEIGRNSFLLNLNYSHRNIEDIKLNVISINIGGLF